MKIAWWTLGLQVVNVVVLIWLLQRFFWRPITTLVAKRRSEATSMLAEAQAQRDQAAARLADLDRERADRVHQQDASIAAAQAAAQKVRVTMLAAAQQEVEELAVAARLAMDKERQTHETLWAERANTLALHIAQRLLGCLDAATIQSAFLHGLLGEIGKLPDPQHNAAAARGAALEVLSAAPLDPTLQERCREQIGDALKIGSPRIAFRTDPQLIAGLELHGPHLIVSNSWRADLEHIQSSLGDATRS